MIRTDLPYLHALLEVEMEFGTSEDVTAVEALIASHGAPDHPMPTYSDAFNRYLMSLYPMIMNVCIGVNQLEEWKRLNRDYVASIFQTWNVRHRVPPDCSTTLWR